MPNQGGTLPRPPGHSQRPPTGGLHRIIEFPTAAGMVAQVAESTLPPSVTALTKAVQAMAHR